MTDQSQYTNRQDQEAADDAHWAMIQDLRESLDTGDGWTETTGTHEIHPDVLRWLQGQDPEEIQADDRPEPMPYPEQDPKARALDLHHTVDCTCESCNQVLPEWSANHPDGHSEGYADLAAESGWSPCAACGAWDDHKHMVVVDGYYYHPDHVSTETDEAGEAWPITNWENPSVEALIETTPEEVLEWLEDPDEGHLADSYHGQFDDDPSPYDGNYSED